MELLQQSRAVMSGHDQLPNSGGIGKDSSDNKFPEADKFNSLLRRSNAHASNIKRVTFVKNGDKFFGGILFTISPHKHKNLDVLMSELTEIIPLPYGVRSILTPQGGSRIESIEQLHNGKTYVCSSRLGLKKMDYSKVKSPMWSPGSKHVQYFEPKRRPRPTVLHTRTAAVQEMTLKSCTPQGTPSIVPLGNIKAKVITVIRNGPPPRQKTKILVNQRSAPSWEHLFQSVSDLFQLRSNPIKRLFMMNGVEVQSISQLLQGGDLFIAVGSEPFDINDFATGVGLPKLRRYRSKLSRKGSETSSADESSSCSESDEKEDMTPTASRLLVRRKHYKRSIKDLRSPLLKSPLEQSTPNPCVLETQNSVSHSPNHIPDISDRVPPIVSQSPDRQLVNGTILNRNSPVTGSSRRLMRHSLDSDQRSKSTESEESNVKEGGIVSTVTPKMRNFISTPSIKPSHPVPDTPNSSHLSMSGQNMIEMTFPPRHLSHRPSERVTRTVGIQARAATEQMLDSELASSQYTISSETLADKSRGLDSFYVKGNTLGEGRFAIVKAATHRTSGKEYAVKTINRAKVFSREDIIENELKIIKSVNHPNIIKLIEDFETPDEINLVMELLQGGDLFDAIVHCHHLTEATCKRITRDLGHALLYLHGKRIVHRDLKPENIFISLSPDGSHSLKLGDFGLATVVTEPLSLICGTPCYTAPEMLMETGYGVKVDIWACGVICYIMLCGIPPFGSQKNTVPVIYENIKKGVYSFSAPIWETISAEAKDLVTMMLQYSPNRRCSAEEMLRHPWLRDSDNMVDHFRGYSSDGLARKFHDHIQSQSRTKTNIGPILFSTALDRKVHQMHNR